MASVTIDMGFGRRATLSTDGGSRQSLEHRSAVLELMLHWPKYTGLTTGAAGFLRELQLGLFKGDPVAALKSAIEDGRVSVSIDRAVPSIGGVADQPSTRPFSRRLRRASVPSVPALPVDKPLPEWATWSDVSADSLIDYLEGVVAEGHTAEFAQRADTLLGDARPFDYVGRAASDGVESLAASTNNPNFAAKMLGYDRKTFGQMLHVLKPANGLGPADNLIFHDSGDVEFKGVILDNIHDYAP